MAGRFREYHLQRRTHLRREQVPAARASIAHADHDMRMDLGLASLKGDVAKQGQHLDLLVDGHALVILAFPVEIAQDGFAESTDRAEAARSQAMVRGEAF